MKILIPNYCLFVFLSVLSCSKTAELKTFSGTIDTHFHLSSTHQITTDKRKSYEDEIESYAKKKDLLLNYFNELSSGDSKSAKEILKSDSILKTKDDFTLSYMFMLLRMKELGVLYKPLLQVSNEENSAEGILISCSPEQLKQLQDDDKNFELHCRFVGELLLENIKVYELVSYE